MLMESVYNLQTFQFVGGNYKNIRVCLPRSSNEDLSTGIYTVNFSLTRWGERGSAVLSKEATLMPCQTGYYIDVKLFPEETMYLHGKFIYQIAIFDEAGYVEIPGRGIIDIIRNINPSAIDSDNELIISLTETGVMSVDGSNDLDGLTVMLEDGVLTVSK